jgi:hypothetical protein
VNEELIIGKPYEIPYPFVRVIVELCNEEGFYKEESWKPGIKLKDMEETADDVGKMVITMVSTHRPGPFPERVFYTRKWIDPDGKSFGKRKLLITPTYRFKNLLKGYRYDFFIVKTGKYSFENEKSEA